MSATVFISYSRWNKPFADRLRIDLARAGVTPWLDDADLRAGTDWLEAIRAGIDASDRVLLLASPEAAASKYVKEELDYAATRPGAGPAVPLLVGGTADVVPEWGKRHMLDFRGRYWEELPRLLGELGPGLVRPSNVRERLDSPGLTTTAAAADLWHGDDPRTRGRWELWAAGRSFVKLPVGPTGYTTTWLIAPADAPLRLPDELAVMLRFAGKPEDHRPLQEVLEFWCGRPGEPWLLCVEGPSDPDGKKGYELTGPHAWRDGIDASVGAVREFRSPRRRLGLFLYAPVALGFAVGGILREMTPYRVYALSRAGNPSDGTYQVVHQHG